MDPTSCSEHEGPRWHEGPEFLAAQARIDGLDRWNCLRLGGFQPGVGSGAAREIGWMG